MRCKSNRFVQIREILYVVSCTMLMANLCGDLPFWQKFVRENIITADELTNSMSISISSS